MTTRFCTILPTAFFFLFLAGCSTTVTSTDSGPYAPQGSARKGTVAYNPYGMKELIDSRRESALKRIYEICGSNKYKITREEIREKDKSESESLATFGTAKLKYVDFECL